MRNSTDKEHQSLNKVHLDPIEYKHYNSLMKIKSKQQNFILDCTNTQQSKLESYSYLKDKYLTYFVVRIPKKIRMETQKTEKKTQLDAMELKKFIQKKKNKILRQNKTLSQDFSNQKENMSKPKKKKTLKAHKHKKTSQMDFNENSPVKYMFKDDSERQNRTHTREFTHHKSPTSVLRCQ